jgi:hypothetical protein
LRKHALAIVQGGDVDDAQHRVEDDPGSVGAESARHLVAVPQEPDRGKSGPERGRRPGIGFGDHGEEGGLAIVDQTPIGRQRLKRGLRRGVSGRSQEGKHNIATGKRIEGPPMAA